MFASVGVGCSGLWWPCEAYQCIAVRSTSSGLQRWSGGNTYQREAGPESLGGLAGMSADGARRGNGDVIADLAHRVAALSRGRITAWR